MKIIRITIVGNSVAIRVRPPQKNPYNKNYGQILEDILQERLSDKIVAVRNKGFGRATITDIMTKFDDIINTFPNYYILNIGVPDASTREIPFWYANILNMKNDFFIKTLLGSIHSRIFKKYSSFFVKLRGKKSWISIKKFEKYYDHIIKTLEKETNAKIITLSINRANERIENAIPGSSRSFEKYNKVIEEISDRNDLIHLNLDDLNCETDYPDGIHFSAKGSRIVAKQISEIIIHDLKE
ncbi:MAG: hypothetical protein HN704_02305 [Bacteroidetes bacterium]|jgi:lysophospholipase L1-like esterase|nr:hypothetical protein [Bacteroidota bacterium]MBT6687358.1 hypothetical protein [Bacteroidota bacterium]MBT7144608.1 hypothetical protein [Bacteroidota bacterium]MBT7490418.1 hypothetical protein [Bacteroidota bacterium]